MKKLLVVASILIALVSFAGCSSGRAVVAERPNRVIVIPPQPGPGYFWRNNAWRWGGGRRYYRPAPVIVSPYGYRGRGRNWNRY